MRVRGKSEAGDGELSFVSAIGTHVPALRLTRAAMAAATGWLSASDETPKGARSLAFWDEDPITMGTAAARDCLDASDAAREAVRALSFATTSPVFSVPQSGAFVHAALRLASDCLVQDLGGTPRATLAALHAALEGGRPALVVGADLAIHPAGSAAERRFGDGAAAAAVGFGEPLLAYLGGASTASPFVDRYRAADGGPSVVWEERWIREEGLLGHIPPAVADALRLAGAAPADIAHFICPSPVAGGAKAVARAAGLDRAAVADDLGDVCGDTGSAHALMMLAAALERIRPGDMVVLAQFGQGATALVLRATEAVSAYRPRIAAQLASGIPETAYLKLPLFRGRLEWERGLRGRTVGGEALTTAFRRHDALLGFVGGKCRETGAVQFPPSRLGVAAGLHLDTQEPWPLADRLGTVATCTADRLAFSRSPPNCYGLVDFDGGGRLMMDFTDPDAETLGIGARVRFALRVKDIDERTGWRRYFWKAVAATRSRSGEER